MSKRPSPMPPQAKAMRDKAMALAMKRKEDYLGARVSRELKARVIARAEALGIPVSLLIRKTLEEAFLPRDASLAAGCETAPAGEQCVFPQVLGWKALELNQPRPCQRCARWLDVGEEAVLGLMATAEEGWVIVCQACKQQALARQR